MVGDCELSTESTPVVCVPLKSLKDHRAPDATRQTYTEPKPLLTVQTKDCCHELVRENGPSGIPALYQNLDKAKLVIVKRV